jgi:hypothetical protein
VKQSKHWMTRIGPSEIARVVGSGGDILVCNDGITEVEKAERSPLPRIACALSCYLEIHRLREAVKQPSFIVLSRMSNFPDILFTSKVKVLVSVIFSTWCRPATPTQYPKRLRVYACDICSGNMASGKFGRQV